MNGHQPLLMDLKTTHDDIDHIVALFRVNGFWGGITKTNHAVLRYREPVYRTLRELALSYFEVYFNLRGERTLRTFSRPVDMRRFDHLDWMTTEKPVWFVAEYLLTISHTRLISRAQAKRLHRLDGRSFRAGCLERAEK